MRCKIKGCNEKATGIFHGLDVCKYCFRKLVRAQKTLDKGKEPRRKGDFHLFDKKAIRML